ncbi:phosphotransferase enzyme family protein-like protein [Cadophora sp. DSE1049]|nr:phosphotransferase enzyme family protein-like protein [Cadophora sp. DSE1049]
MMPANYIAERNAKDAQQEYIRKFVEATPDIVSFVDNCLGWNEAGEFLRFFKGSFNLSIAIRNSVTNERVIIRFPIPGKVYDLWRAKKVKHEVTVMTYLREHTSIPVPHVYYWGLTEESLQRLGPFIIMEFMEGENLGDILKKPTPNEADLAILDPDINEAKLNGIFEQLASLMLELSCLEFPRIGAISKDAVSGEWTVAEPLLTYDMNEVVSFAGFPAEHFTTMPVFDRSSNYFTERAQYLQIHLETQRTAAYDTKDITWGRYVARHCFAKLIPTYGMIDDAGPHRLFCDDMRPSNMLVNPETMDITALLDFEFTNPGIEVSEGETGKQKFLDLFEPRKEQFIHVMERVEARSARPAGEPLLSARMRDSWDSGRFWFNLTSRNSVDVDQIYWQILHKEGLGEAMLDTATLAGKEEFLERKEVQFKAYLAEKQSDTRFDE